MPPRKSDRGGFAQEIAQEISKAINSSLDSAADNFAKKIIEAVQTTGGGPPSSTTGGAPSGALRPYRGHDVRSVGDDLSSQIKDQAGGGIGGGIAGAIPGLLAGAGNYAASRTPYGTTGTTDMLGQNLQMGLLKGLSDAAAPVPVLGGFIQKQVQGLEEAVYQPEARARGRLSPVFEQMAKAGIDVSDQEITQAFQYALPMERRGVYMQQRVARLSAQANADGGSALSGALSQIGL